MLRLIYNFFNKRYIKFSFVGKYGFKINTNLNDQELYDFLFMIYNHSLIGSVMENMKVNNEDQYDRVNALIESATKEVLENKTQEEEKPIIGVISENNIMGRS